MPHDPYRDWELYSKIEMLDKINLIWEEMLRRRKQVAGAEITTTVHATESEEKVIRVLANILPRSLKHKLNTITAVQTKGYYGNPMKRLTINLGPDEALEMLRYILRNIDDLDFENFIATIDQRFDGRNKLFIRVSKQDAFSSRIKLIDSGDVVRIMFTVLGFDNYKDLEEFIRALRMS